VADGTSFRAQESQRAAQELADVAKLLSGLMSQFKIKRRDARIDLSLPVRVTVTDAKGNPAEQQVTTVDISRQGALIRGFRGEVRTGKILSLSRNNKKQEFRVAWVGQGHGPGGRDWPIGGRSDVGILG
jgi:hypothetical protein